MPGEVLCRVQARSLVLDMQPHIKADPHTLNNLFLHTQDYPPNVSSHTHARSAADRARLCRASFFPPLRRRKAPRKIPAQPDSSSLTPVRSTAEQSACGHSFPRGRECGLSPRLSPASKPGSSSGAASLFVPPFFSGAPPKSAGIAPGHLEKGPVRLLRAAAVGAACRVLQFVLSRHGCLPTSKPHLR